MGSAVSCDGATGASWATQQRVALSSFSTQVLLQPPPFKFWPTTLNAQIYAILQFARLPCAMGEVMQSGTQAGRVGAEVSFASSSSCGRDGAILEGGRVAQPGGSCCAGCRAGMGS